ncbi:hypothetical protein L2719_14190 [Shewanella schlegeliana]|uniref:Uncharacterized protein n=1 Tax=Shewanella schlegeliana TaxID=190308 RepID=A0ABS1SV03_9GAMM|nr:hypothetical protein [Shewanella schlegeliana]MBL4912219.1 hypothetical protein [Shewanella schlegeliana]MCL1110694.1 hypothetical protein [Shewanella schlegeliana]GIU22576.1 hypothetical protein TUM4433_03710 [Shewanella schlegeliana]
MGFTNALRSLIVLSMLTCSAAMAIEQPIVVSFADQPIHKFNQKLELAQQQQRSWSKQPESISAHYAGSSFQLAKVKQYQGKVVTYNVSGASAEHPKMLLILSMEKQKDRWTLDAARLTWQCKNGLHFGTDRCLNNH